MSSSKRQGALFGLAAALLFGISPPFAKLLLPESGPMVTAGLLYLGAGLGLLLFEMTGRPFHLGVEEAPVRRADAGLLAGVILTGGMLGPFLMLWGLERLSGVLTSLLLNLEAPFTVLIAILVLREHLVRLELAGVLVIVVGGGILMYRPGAIRGDIVGILAVLGACLCWALDNNLSQRLSLRDPLVVTRMKTLGAGIGMLGLAALTSQPWPTFTILLATFLLGLVSYGVSLVLDMRALRLLGAAREAGFFATAPFIGAVVAVPVLGERWDIQDATATALMMAGVALLSTGATRMHIGMRKSNMTTAISTKSITTTCTMEALSLKNRMRTCIGTSPSPMITRTCRNCITVMIIRSREEQGVEPLFRAARHSVSSV